MGMLADEDRARSPSAVDPLWISADSWWKSPNKEGAPPVPLHLPLDGIPSNASTIVQPANRIRIRTVSAFDAMAAAAADDDDEGSATSADKEADKEANKECRTWVRERNCCA